jgi:hypothetical protein
MSDVDVSQTGCCLIHHQPLSILPIHSIHEAGETAYTFTDCTFLPSPSRHIPYHEHPSPLITYSVLLPNYTCCCPCSARLKHSTTPPREIDLFHHTTATSSTFYRAGSSCVLKPIARVAQGTTSVSSASSVDSGLRVQFEVVSLGTIHFAGHRGSKLKEFRRHLLLAQIHALRFFRALEKYLTLHTIPSKPSPAKLFF